MDSLLFRFVDSGSAEIFPLYIVNHLVILKFSLNFS